MKNRQILFIIIALAASCTERVDPGLEAAGEPLLVVFSEITSDIKVHEVKLGKSAAYFDNKPMEMVSGANITLSDGDETIQLDEDPVRPGFYLTPDNYSGKTGRIYQLKIAEVDINNDGIPEDYSAETEMKPAAVIHGVQVGYSSSREGWDVAIYSQDREETTDYYLFKVYKNGILYTDSLSDYRTTDDRFFNGNEINGLIVQYFDEEEGEIVERGDTITLEIAGITEEYFDYIEGILTETNEKVPLFSGPSANVKGNVSNGALGFFAVMEVERNSIIYHH